MEIQDFINFVKNSRLKREKEIARKQEKGNLYSVTFYMLDKRMVKFITGENRQDAINKFKTLNRDAEIVGVQKSNVNGRIKIK